MLNDIDTMRHKDSIDFIDSKNNLFDLTRDNLDSRDGILSHDGDRSF